MFHRSRGASGELVQHEPHFFIRLFPSITVDGKGRRLSSLQLGTSAVFLGFSKIPSQGKIFRGVKMHKTKINPTCMPKRNLKCKDYNAQSVAVVVNLLHCL